MLMIIDDKVLDDDDDDDDDGGGGGGSDDLECAKLAPDHVYDLNDLNMQVKEEQVASDIHGRLQHKLRHRGAGLCPGGVATLHFGGGVNLAGRKQVFETKTKQKSLSIGAHSIKKLAMPFSDC
ncbi:hypothetical protein PoB_000335300 [Plakobranchus ocellatus]|uniref:Uncharacterized protein n=1 Tax=Plakobranchus ocellatus TaxID=259542 RepID=A0AAV3Y2K5_9GAST|nr:hypothetical protein PoB_000335300 [Plakobranchus ocellatus]